MPFPKPTVHHGPKSADPQRKQNPETSAIHQLCVKLPIIIPACVPFIYSATNMIHIYQAPTVCQAWFSNPHSITKNC